METERQIRELEKAMTTTDNRRLYERCLAVKLVLEGHTRKAAGHTIGRDEHTVSHYMKNYCHNGLSWTRPTYTLKKADSKKQQVFLEETFPSLKKNC